MLPCVPPGSEIGRWWGVALVLLVEPNPGGSAFASKARSRKSAYQTPATRLKSPARIHHRNGSRFREG